MKLSPAWLREFVDAKVDDRRMAHDLTSVGIAVESISGEGKDAVFEMEIGTNRPDAMNHYGVAREAAVIYNLPLRAVDSKLPATPGKSSSFVRANMPSPFRCSPRSTSTAATSTRCLPI